MIANLQYQGLGWAAIGLGGMLVEQKAYDLLPDTGVLNVVKSLQAHQLKVLFVAAASALFTSSVTLAASIALIVLHRKVEHPLWCLAEPNNSVLQQGIMDVEQGKFVLKACRSWQLLLFTSAALGAGLGAPCWATAGCVSLIASAMYVHMGNLLSSVDQQFISQASTD